MKTANTRLIVMNTLISRNFCENMRRGKFCNFNTVETFLKKENRRKYFSDWIICLRKFMII